MHADFGVSLLDAREVRDRAVRDAKTGLILDAALRVFAQNGYHNTRLEDIAAAAGFSKAALYTYYDSKEAIFLNLAVREHDRLQERLLECNLPERPFSENLRCMARSVLEMFGEHFAILLSMSEFHGVNPEELESLAKHHSSLIGEFRGRYERGQQLLESMVANALSKGEITSSVPDKVLAAMISAQFRGVMFDWKMSGSKGDVHKEVDYLVEFILHGMRSNT